MVYIGIYCPAKRGIGIYWLVYIARAPQAPNRGSAGRRRRHSELTRRRGAPQASRGKGKAARNAAGATRRPVKASPNRFRRNEENRQRIANIGRTKIVPNGPKVRKEMLKIRSNFQFWHRKRCFDSQKISRPAGENAYAAGALRVTF